MKFFRRGIGLKKRYTAVDVGSSGIKILELSALRGGIQVEKVINYPSPPIVDYDDQSLKLLTVSIQKAFSASGISSREVITAIGRQKVITRHIHLPKMPVKELEQAIKWEAEKYIPLPINQLIVRYVNLGEVVVDGVRQLHLLLVAVPTDLVYSFYEAFARAGLDVVAIDLQSLAVWRVYSGIINPAPAIGTYAVVDLGAMTSIFVVIREQALHLIRELPVGGDLLRRGYKQPFVISPEHDIHDIDGVRGEPEMVQFEIFPMGETAAGLEKVNPAHGGISQITREIQRSLDFYKLQERDLPVEKIVLTGGAGKMEGIADIISAELGLPAEVVPPVLPLPGGNSFETYEPSLTVALGLALREVIK